MDHHRHIVHFCLGDRGMVFGAPGSHLSQFGRTMRAQHIKRLSKRQEHRLAKARGGKVRWASGAGPMKEDVSDRVALGQCKATERDSIRLHYADLKKIQKHAAAEDRLPYVELLFERRNPLDTLRVYLVFETEFKRHFPQEEDHEPTDGLVLGELDSGRAI
jgi:hypothetical protein